MKRYILNTLLLLLPFYGVVAQKMDCIKWVSHFEALTESEEYNDTCVLDKDSVHHAIRGARRVIEFSSENYTIEWFSSTIVVNDEKRSHNVMEKTNSISFEVEEAGRYHLLLDSIKLISKDGVGDTICRNLDIDSFDIKLYKAPHISENDIEGRLKEVIWDNTERELGVEYSGGNDSDWTFVWKLGEDVVSEVFTNVWKRPIEKTGSQTLTLEVKNISPDGETLWFESACSCDFQVYRYPTNNDVGLKFGNSDCPKSMDWYCEDTSTDEISISTRDVEGDNWTYEWQYAGETVSTEKSFRPSMNDDDVSFYDKGKEYSYKVVVTNQPAGMADSLSYQYETEKHVVNFWKTPKIDLFYDGYKVVFDSTDVVVDINVEGGIPGYKPTLSLSLNDEAISMSRESLEQIKFRSSANKRKEDRKYQLSIRFLNEMSSVEPEKEPIELTIWKTPVVSLLYKSNNTALEGSNPVEKDGIIYVCEKFGGKVELFVNKENGDDDGWIYSWRELNYAEETVSTESKDILVKEAGPVADFELEIINCPEGMKKEDLQFKKIIPFKVEICPTPSINLEDIKSVYAGVHGEHLTLELGNNEIGRGGKWIYQWKRDGDKDVLEDKTATLSLKNTTDIVFSEGWIAKPIYYGPLGDVWYGDEEGEFKTFSVNIYPRPADGAMNIKGFDESRLDAFYEGTMTYGIGFEGTYPYATDWEYEILYSGIDKESISGEGDLFSPNIHKISPNPIEEGEGCSMTNVKLLVKCSVRDEEADTTIIVYSDEKSLDYYAWRKGEIRQDKNYPEYTYFDDEAELKVNRLFGYTGAKEKGGWEYTWTLDDVDVGYGELYSYKCNNEESAKSVTYILHCRNVLNGEVGTDSIFHYTFKEYAKIEEEISVEEPYVENMREGDVVTIKAIGNLQKGNPDGWHYEWNNDGMKDVKDAIPTKEFECLMKSSGNSMETEDVTYTLSCYNYGPDGSRILGKMEREFHVKVHRKPKVTEFRKKGDGTSNIYIAVSPSIDADFEFGEGNQPKLNADAERNNFYGIGDNDVKYYSKDENYYMPYRYSSSPEQPWVRTFWDYGDGFRCYSDVCVVESELKAPSYSRELMIEDGYFFVNLDEEKSAIVVLYTLEGKEVWKQQYAPQKVYNEHLDFEGITSGTYILKCVVGEQQVVKKIVIR